MVQIWFFTTIVNLAGTPLTLTLTVSHCIVFREILEIARLHPKQIIDLSDQFSHTIQRAGRMTILLSGEYSWTLWRGGTSGGKRNLSGAV